MAAEFLILGILNQEHHQECYNGGTRVDDELPRIREIEERTRDCPHHDRPARNLLGMDFLDGSRRMNGFLKPFFFSELFLMVDRMLAAPVECQRSYLSQSSNTTR
jgi:hypothetical protein